MEAYIFEGLRSPIGKGHAQKGAMRNVKPLDLLKQLLEAMQSRTHFAEKDIDELILGCVSQVLEQGGNIAKASAAYCGLYDIPGTTLNNYCSSGMAALGLATAKIKSGMTDMAIAGGIEMLSRVPMYADRASIFTEPEIMEKTRFTQMGCAADLIASVEGHNREELEAYAILSHHRAAKATKEGFFDKSLIAIKEEDGTIALEKDENIKPQTTKEIMQSFEPLFKKFVTPFVRQKMDELYLKGKDLKDVHHVGTSPNLADGASMLLVGTLEKGKELGLKPRAKIIGYEVQAVEPLMMLLGGQKATEILLKKKTYQSADMDLHYYAEAFASTCLKYQKEMNVAWDKFNPNGGTMSLGHAQGSSGAALVIMLLDELERSDKQIGVASISGLAMGTSIIIERV